MSTAEIKKAMMEKIREAKIAAKTRAGVAKAPEADIL
jgi:hypothetical protein